MPRVAKHPTQAAAAQGPVVSSRFAQAVRAAIAAYEKSGKMLDAALAYAFHGIPVFPLTANKTPVPARDKDANGVPIPGTGSFKKASVDPEQIFNWWNGNEYLIGMPTGPWSGVLIVDIDTSEDHADGYTAWTKIAAGRDPIITREHRSATDGPHLIFEWDEKLPLGCSSGALPDGIEVKGQGGYVVLPPSRRKRRAYTVYRDIDPIPAPAWLIKLITQGRTPSNAPFSGQITADQEELADALASIPNDDLSWADWKSMGLRIFAATEGKGFGLFETWSQKSDKYDYHKTQGAWGEIVASPPSKTGAAVIFGMAKKLGWERWLHPYMPSYPRRGEQDIAAARADIAAKVGEFWRRTEQFHRENEKWLKDRRQERRLDKIEDKIDFFAFVETNRLRVSVFAPVPPVMAMRIPAGVGKTQEVIVSFAALRGLIDLIALTQKGRPLVYTVDRHKLGDEIVARFAAVGVRAKLFRGRSAVDPADPEGKDKMCRNTVPVALAARAMADVNETCCRQGQRKCRLFDVCAYQLQKQGEPPEVWIMAHDMLFYATKVFGRPAAVIVDESMWQKGIRGLDGDDDEWVVPLASLITTQPYDVNSLPGQRTRFRDQLGCTLAAQIENGGVRRETLAQLGYVACSMALQLEWGLVPELGLFPGMGDFQVRSLDCDNDKIDAIRHCRHVIRLWETVRDLIGDPTIKVSGRLTLKQQGGQRVIEWRGVAPVRKVFQVPTLLLDATLPALPLLQVYHPQVKTVADVKVATPPHVFVRQVLDAPTSSNKLESKAHLQEIHLYIIKRWLETGRQSTVVICQQKVEEHLQAVGLPENIKTAHFNDIAGNDQFGHVRLLILIGRTAPGPQAVESLAGALTGARPPSIVKDRATGFVWYPQVKQGIGLRDGFGILTMGDQHPDPMAEAVRWQIHEAQLIQARGRAREVNRTAATPLDIDQLFDSCLPLPVDLVTRWRSPSWLVAIAGAYGVMLTSSHDLMTAWPKIWTNRSKADRTLKHGVPDLPGFERVEYQLEGPKMKRRVAFFDRAIVPDPRSWLTQKLGKLAPDATPLGGA